MASLEYMNLIRWWDRPDRSEQVDGRQPGSKASRLQKSSCQSIGLPFVLYIFKSPAIRPLSWKLPPPSCPCGKASIVSQIAMSSSFTDLEPVEPPAVTWTQIWFPRPRRARRTKPEHTGAWADLRWGRHIKRMMQTSPGEGKRSKRS